MRLFVPSVALALAVLPLAATAGVNEGGVLILHSSATSYSVGQSWCGESGLASCDSALTSTPADPEVVSVLNVIAAFPADSTPRLMGVSFGVQYDASRLVILASGHCGDLDLPLGDWPAPGTSTAVAWTSVQTGPLVDVAWFAAYADSDTAAAFVLTPHAEWGAMFADDSLPAVVDTIAALGSFGFGMPGDSPCPQTGDEDSAEYEDGELEEQQGDAPGDAPPPPPPQPPAAGRCASNLVLVRFRPNIVAFPGENRGAKEYFVEPISAAAFTLPDLRSRLLDLGVTNFETVAPEWRHMTAEDKLDRRGKPVDLVDFTDVYRLELDGRADVDEVIADLWGRPGIMYAECQPLIEFHFTPNDTLFDRQWSLHNDGSLSGCIADNDVNMPEAWEIWRTAGTKIGFSDDAMTLEHPDLGPYIDQDLSQCFFTGCSPWVECSPLHSSHSTSVACVAAAGSNNMAFVASPANLRPFGADSLLVVALVVERGLISGDKIANSERALAYVLGDTVNGAIRIVNHSWGFPSFKDCYSYSRTLRNAFRNGFLNDLHLVCSAGNEESCSGACSESDSCLNFPAAFGDYSLAISATDCEGGRPDDWFRGRYIDLAAPAVAIPVLQCNPAGYGIVSGTSGAAPLVAGIIALMLGAEPDLTNEDCTAILKHTARPLLQPIETGAGLVRADAALRLLVPPRRLVQDSVLTFASMDSVGSWSVQLMNLDSDSTTTEQFQTFWVDAFEIIATANVPSGVELIWPRGRESTGWKKIDASMDWRYDILFHANSAELVHHGQGQASFRTWTYRIRTEEHADSTWWEPFAPDGTFRIAYSYIEDTEYPSSVATADSQTNDPWIRPVPAVFRGATGGRLEFQVGRAGPYSVDVFDLSGRVVRRLLRGRTLPAGRHGVVWDGRGEDGRTVTSGVYFVRLCGSPGTSRVNENTRVTVLR